MKEYKMPARPKNRKSARKENSLRTAQEDQMLVTAHKLRKLVVADFVMKTANPAIAAIGRLLLPALRSLGPKVLQMIKKIPPGVWATMIPSLANSLAPKNPAAPAAADVSNQRGASSKKEDEEENEEDTDDDEEAGLGSAALGALAGGLTGGPVGAGLGAIMNASSEEENEEDDDEDEEAGLGGAAIGGLLGGPIGAGIGMMASVLQVGSLASILHENKVPNPDIVAKSLVLATIETRNAHARKANPEVDEAIQLVRQMQAELRTLKEFI